MTNEEKRADDLRIRTIREELGHAPTLPWRLLSADEQGRWLRAARAESPNGTLAAAPRKGSSFTPASVPQRQRVAGEPCVVLDDDDPCAGPVDPAHVLDRALGGDDDPRMVVPLCRHHHQAYDNQELSILEYLEPRYRDALAASVEKGGLLSTLQQVTGVRWAPETAVAAGQKNPLASEVDRGA